MEEITYREHLERHPNFTGVFENSAGKFWCRYGELHREDEPACEWVDGGKDWYRNGLLHREGGPAIEWAGGGKSWYLHGENMSKEEHRGKVRTNKLEEFFKDNA